LCRKTAYLVVALIGSMLKPLSFSRPSNRSY
jgi:hypothetical protein